jgi:hypothetical protein
LGFNVDGFRKAAFTEPEDSGLPGVIQPLPESAPQLGSFVNHVKALEKIKLKNSS